MKLPESFISEMKDLLGEEEYLQYEQSLMNSPRSGIRINTRKISKEEFEKIAPFEIESIPYIDNGYYIVDTDAASKHPYYFAGLYYIQEPSAMVPASCAQFDNEAYVLDLCAAPGGKTTELMRKMPAFLLSNDISYSRTIPLVKNMDLFGSGPVLVSCESPDKLESVYSDFFDVILVDAPCSGEGMFRKDSSLIKDWIEKGPAYYHDIQVEILKSASNMLRNGGCIIYSTCTFSLLEDEKVLKEVLDDNETLILDELPHFEGFEHGFTVDEKYDFSKCIRLFPHKMNGEGHFIAKLKKRTDANGSDEKIHQRKNLCGKRPDFLKYEKLPLEVKEFVKHIKSEKVYDDFYIANDCVYMIPDTVARSMSKGIHYSRTGIMLGQLKKNVHFVPHNSAALYLAMNDFDNVLNLKSNDLTVIRYLKGETLILDDEGCNVSKGYTLVCVDGFPLGFAKFDGTKFKNLYTTGWRYNGN